MAKYQNLKGGAKKASIFCKEKEKNGYTNYRGSVEIGGKSFAVNVNPDGWTSPDGNHGYWVDIVGPFKKDQFKGGL